MSFVVQHGIENNEELAHAGGERGFGVLTIGPQPQIESSDGGITTDSRLSPYTGRAGPGRVHPRYTGCRAVFHYRG